jgi:glycosyltransferase involved in cell wall biosynthesis
LADPNVVFLIAALNEEEGIGLTLSELRKLPLDPYLLVVDGNSADGTVDVARNLKADIIFQEEEKGKGAAISQGLDYLRDLGLGCDYLAFTDADYTYPAEHVPRMLEVLRDDRSVGMVVGDRFDEAHEYRKSMQNVFYYGNRLLALSHSVLNGVDLKDPLSGLRIVRWDLLKDWKPKSKSFDIEVELNHRVVDLGYSIVEVPIQYRPRLGHKKLTPKHGLTIFSRIITQSIA